ncbi:hypothetical protein J1605_011156 [Eschrichtius robustus]|uniref:Uncharacterized protein n=1 Tax=Eschrichtius robustus TaxID=9764 RepID=A0AB34GKW0_ESCRO|nr:hypothetical protein J1605_011156 [Eschrichtius robustus]
MSSPDFDNQTLAVLWGRMDLIALIQAEAAKITPQ